MVDEAKNNLAPAEQPAVILETASSTPETPLAGLPSAGTAGANGANGGNGSAEIMAQNIYFGDYYQPIEESFELKAPAYSLPLNVKVDIANYYDIYRKINLDAGLDSLNNNGFAVLNNPFSVEAGNFYEMYAVLDSKNVPLLITSDFLIYYYQNILKQAYKDIEGSVFYDNLWETNKKLYQAAKDRYEKNLEQKGQVNDVSLEGSRLEAAYFATALVLLSPLDSQISRDSGLSQKAGFSPAEADQFSFQLPAYLQDDVNREIALIRKANEKSKSPVLLYERDYKSFLIPAAYQNNARLNNFYLASVWLNSVFPLYPRSADCPNCLLDKEDWRINMFAAFLIAGDLSDNQQLQNRWAKIYKLQTFFGGLRNDLSYLDYQRASEEVFAGQKTSEVLGGAGENIDVDLAKLQDKISGIFFAPIEGGLEKTATDTRPFLGMKMLVGAYSPDEYILKSLTFPGIGSFLGSEKEAEAAVTACSLRDQKGFSRCAGSAFDIINLVYPLGAGNQYFSANSRYQDYDSRMEGLRAELSKFTASSWHNRNYWAVLDVAGKLLSAPEKKQVVFMKSGAWQEKDLNTAIASWVNAELPADIFAPSERAGAVRLNQSGGEKPFAVDKYIEPNLTLNRELLANTRMISKVLVLLDVADGENTVLAELNNLQEKLEITETIIKKELRSEDLSEEDYLFIDNLAKEFSVKETAGKLLRLPAAAGAGFSLQENITGVKLLMLVYPRGDKKLFAVGPVFDFREERK
jgi:hypothetical protein